MTLDEIRPKMIEYDDKNVIIKTNDSKIHIGQLIGSYSEFDTSSEEIEVEIYIKETDEYEDIILSSIVSMELKEGD